MIKTITQINISDAEITGIRYLSGNELFVLGHYPHLTMFPGVLSLMLIRLLIQLYCSKITKVVYLNRFLKFNILVFLSLEINYLFGPNQLELMII